MNQRAGKFMKAAVIYGFIGFALGVYMGAKHDFALMSVHSHLNLLGWASLAICAFYYQLVPDAARSAASKIHFWIANAGLVILLVSLALLANGVAAAPGAAIGSVISLIAFMIFVYIVLKTAKITPV